MIYALDAIATTEEVVSAMMADPRLLHVGEDEARELLSRIYTDEFYRGTVVRITADAVPEIFFCAFRQGKMQPLFGLYDTLYVAFEVLGSTCCLCGAVDYRGPGRMPDRLMKHLAPRVSEFEYHEDGVREVMLGHHAPICSDCYRPFHRRIGAAVLWRGEPEEVDAWATAKLAALIDNHRFHERVQKNAGRWSTFRFHPRSKVEALP